MLQKQTFSPKRRKNN